MIYDIYFAYIVNCNIAYIVFLMCKDTYVPHKFLLQINVYVCYIYKGNKRCRETRLTYKILQLF